MRSLRPLLSALALLPLIGCAEAPSGWAELDDLGVLGVLPTGETYLCGTGDHVDQSTWISGDAVWTLTMDGQNFSLEGEEGAWSGELTGFDEGGLYSATPNGCRSGAILHAGTLSGSWCDGEGTFSQVEPIDPVTGEPGEILVRPVDFPDEPYTLQRLP